MKRICSTARWLKIADAALQAAGVLVVMVAGAHFLVFVLLVQLAGHGYWSLRHDLPVCSLRRYGHLPLLALQTVCLFLVQGLPGPVIDALTLLIATGYGLLTLFEIRYYYRRSLPAYH